MKRIVLTKPFNIAIEETETPVPDRGQILVRTRASGISAGTEMALYRGTNHDLVLRRWGPQWTYPMYTGYEAVGEVVELGPGVSEPNVGDRVLLYGHHAEYSVAVATQVLKLPDTLADKDALLAVLGTTALLLLVAALPGRPPALAAPRAGDRPGDEMNIVDADPEADHEGGRGQDHQPGGLGRRGHHNKAGGHTRLIRTLRMRRPRWRTTPGWARTRSSRRRGYHRRCPLR